MGAVTDLYDMALATATGREELRSSTRAGDINRYHAVLRSRPEIRLAEPLRVVRRSLSALAEERRRLPDSLTPELRQIQEDQITAAMEQVAAGTLLWARELLHPKPATMVAEVGSSGQGNIHAAAV